MRILGIELGGWSVKAVEMESRFRRLEILDLHEIRLPLENVDPTASYKKAISDLFARLPVNPEKVVTGIPASQCALRFLQVPLKQRKKVEQSYKYELEDTTPIKLEDAIIEHYLAPTKDGTLVFAAMAPKKHLAGYLEWLKGVGLDPDWLTFEGMGMINLYLAAQRDQPKVEGDTTQDTPVALIDIGHIKTNVAIIHQNRLEFFRSISWGGLALTQAIASSLGVTTEEAENHKIREFKLEDDFEAENTMAGDVLQSGAQAFSGFITDISHSLVSYRTQYKRDVGKVILLGGTSKIQGIDTFFKRALGLEVEFFRAFRGLNFGHEPDKALELRFAEPIGRSLVFGRKSDLLFNFRKEDLAKTSSFNEVADFLKNPNVMKLGTFAGVLAVILFIGISFLGYVAQEESSKANDELRRVFSDTFRSVPAKLRTSLLADPKMLEKFLNDRNKELTQKLKLLSKNRTPMLTLVRSVSDAFPADVKVDVNTLAIDDRTLRMEGVLYEGPLEKVTESLKKIPAFNNVKVETEGQRFTFKGEVVGR